MDTIETISELVEGELIFESKGYSTVKVTRKGVETPLRLPIKSTGVAEFQEKLSQKAPRPPVINEVVKKSSPEGKALGLTHNTITRIFDMTDEAYINKQEKHLQDFTWRVAVFALDMSWKMKDGTTAETYEQKRAILESNRLTGHQIDQIFEDVQKLTKWSEDREDFLSES